MKVIALLVAAIVACALAQPMNIVCPPPQSTPLLNYLCRDKQVSYGAEECNPQFRPYIGSWKGIVVFFHGYSACPQQYNNLAYKLQVRGFDVFLPLNPGHGRPFQSGCTNLAAGADCVQPGYIVTDVPTNYTAYLTFVTEINAIVASQLSARRALFPAITQPIVMVGGLSVGAALAVVAGALGSRSVPPLYNRQILFTPFIGITNPQGDRDFQNCLKVYGEDICMDAYINQAFQGVAQQQASNTSVNIAAQALVKQLLKDYTNRVYNGAPPQGGSYQVAQSGLRLIMTMAADEPAKFRQTFNISTAQYNNFMQGTYGWGAGCERARDRNTNFGNHRAGFCGFRVSHLLGTNSIGQLALRMSTQTTNIVTQVVTVQRDGFTRNGLIFQTAQGIASGNRTSVRACMYRIVCDTLYDNNTCGVPHSCLSFEDNVGLPGGIWWRDSLEDSVVNFTLGVTREIGTPGAWNGRRDSCSIFNVTHPGTTDPRRELVANVPSLLQLRLAGDTSTWTLAQQTTLVRAISLASGIAPSLINVLAVRSGSIILDLEVDIQNETVAEQFTTWVGYCASNFSCIDGYTLLEVPNQPVIRDDGEYLVAAPDPTDVTVAPTDTTVATFAPTSPVTTAAAGSTSSSSVLSLSFFVVLGLLALLFN